jgi:hypothetical protein
MKDGLSKWDQNLLFLLARVRGLRPDTANKFRHLQLQAGVQAVEKRMVRLCEKGFLARSAVPRGRQLFRLSHRGVRLTGARPAFASCPSTDIAAEMLSLSCVAARSDEYLVLTKEESDRTLNELFNECETPKLIGRLVLRFAPNTHNSSERANRETCLHQWLAELRPANELQRRVETIVANLSRNRVFADLISARVFGITIAVPNKAVKQSFESKTLSIETNLLVVTELQDLFAS